VTGSFDGSAVFWDVTGRRHEKAASLSGAELETEWTALLGEDGVKAHRAVWALAGDAKQVLPLLKERLKPVPGVDEKEIARLIAELDADDFGVREKATRELSKLGAAAEPALRKVLDGSPSAEVRQRALHVLEGQQKGESAAEWVASLRALEVLEHLGTPEARELLQALAKGAPGARLTQEAKAALERVGRRP
jgi:hypothetical protein